MTVEADLAAEGLYPSLGIDFRTDSSLLVSSSRGSSEWDFGPGGVLQTFAGNTVAGPVYDHAGTNIMGLGAWTSATNTFKESQTPATQTAALKAGTYTLWAQGTGSVALSGATTGTATDGHPLTYTLAAPGSVTFTVSGTLDFVQNENRPYPTAPIVTSAAAATRQADMTTLDLAAYPGLADPHHATIVVDFFPTQAVAAGTMWELDDGTADNRITANYRIGDLHSGITVVTGGQIVIGADPQPPYVVTPGQFHRFVASWDTDAGTLAVSLDGSPTNVLAVSDWPGGLDTLRLGTSARGVSLNGYLTGLQAYGAALSAADVQRLSAEVLGAPAPDAGADARSLSPSSVFWSAGDGAWSDASNWTDYDAGGAPAHDLPGGTSAVVFSTAGSGPYRVASNLAGTVWSLQGSGAILDVTGGSLAVTHDSGFGGAVEVERGASLLVANNATLALASGTVSGTLGGGTVRVAGGLLAFEAGASVATAGWIIGAAGTTRLDADLGYGGNMTLGGPGSDGAVLAIGGHMLTLSGAVDLGGTIVGPGTVLVARGGSGTLHASVVAGATVEVQGALLQSGSLSLGGRLQIDAGGSYRIAAHGAISGSGAVTANGGTFGVDDTTGGISEIDGLFTSSGALAITAGNTLRLSSAATLGGAVTGGGTLAIGAGGQATLNASTFAVEGMSIEGGTAVLARGVSYGGTLTLGGSGTLDLAGRTLTLGGVSRLMAGTLRGNGGAIGGALVFAEGSATLGGVAGLGRLGSIKVGGGAVAFDANQTFGGTLVQSGGTVAVDAGSRLTLTGGASFGGAVTGGGTLALSGGTTAFQPGAAVAVASLSVTGGARVTLGGDLTLGGNFEARSGTTVTLAPGHVLTLDGTSMLAGTVRGAGALVLGGAATIGAGVSLAVSTLTLAQATGTLETGLSFKGAFAETASSLDLHGHALRLSGSALFSGASLTSTGPAATVSFSGATTLGDLTLGGGVTVRNSGTLHATQTLHLGDGNGAAAFANSAGAIYDIGGDAGIAGIGSFANAGLMRKSDAGTSVIGLSELNNTGTVEVAGGILDIAGVIHGAGALVIDGGTLELDAKPSRQQTIRFDGDGTLALAQCGAYGNTVASFLAGDAIDLLTMAGGTIQGFASAADHGSGVLTLRDADRHTTSLTLLGAYAASDFVATADPGGHGTTIRFQGATTG